MKEEMCGWRKERVTQLHGHLNITWILFTHYKEEIEVLSVFQSREWKVGVTTWTKAFKAESIVNELDQQA
jgi:hypothetical protein